MTHAAHPLFLCRVYDAGTGTIGARLLVDRLWPRGLSKADLPLDDWIKDAAPSPGLRKWFGHDPLKWASFRKLYEAELAESPQGVAQCLGWCKAGPVTLLYAARDTQHTHALVLRDHLIARLQKEGPIDAA